MDFAAVHPTCSVYCHDGMHALLIATTAGDYAQDFAAIAGQFGARVVAQRRAEVSPAEAMALGSQHTHTFDWRTGQLTAWDGVAHPQLWVVVIRAEGGQA